MATPATVNPFNFYPGRDGLPLQNGYLYFGEPFQDPELQPLQAYWDDANTQPAARPIRTINGYPARNGAPAQVFVGAQYSMRVRDSQGREVFYAPNVTAVDLGGGGLDIITASGGQTVVTLTNAVYTPGSNAIDIALNGIIQISGQDYFETGTNKITMASALSAGDQIRAFARSTFGLTQAVLSDWQAEVFNGAGGASQNFVLTRNPGAVANLDVSVTTAGVGSTLRPLIDYTLSGNTVTITPAPAVGTNNVLIRYGRSLPQDALRGELASTASAADGAGLNGFLYSLLYAQSTAGWGIRTAGDCYNVLRDIPVAQWAAIVAGTSTDDHTSYIATANAAAKAAKLRLFFPGGKYNITPTAVTEVENWCGADAAYTSIYADCASYSGVVLRCVGSNSLRDITIREKNLIKTSGTLVQMSAATTSEFTGYQELHRVWMFGGLKAFDINNTFACKYTLCRMQFAGTGVNGTPIDEAGDNGYFTTQIFDQCIVADNNKNWNIAPAINSDCFTLIQGSTERPAVSKSTFVRLREVSLHDHYFEGSNTIIAASFSCDHKIYGAYVNGTAGIELVNGVNLRSIIEDYLPGSSTDVLTCSGDQTLSIRNSVFPGSGNTFSAAVVNFLGGVSINGTSYNGPRSRETAGASGVRRDVVPQSVSVSGAGATDAYRFLDINGTLVNQSQTGRFYVSAFDNATGANQAVYELRLESCGNGTTDATLTSVSRKVRGTDVGVSATPFTLANDGAGGAVKLQFQKNGAISQVNLKVIYDGVSV